MPLPSPWVGLVLGLAAYRLTRLGGWDDWPPIAKLRAWLLGERWLPTLPWSDPGHDVMADMRDAVLREQLVEMATEEFADRLNLPGKTPDSEVDDVRPAYDRPLLAHLVHCPFCLGWWVSLAVYVWWVATPAWGLYAVAPFALSGFVGLVAKNLDP
jgi:hypothetical protein